MTDLIQALWTSEGADARPLAPEIARRRVRALIRRTWLRDAAEYLAALAVVGAFGSYWIDAANRLIGIGCALIIVGTLVVVVGLWRRRPRPAPDVLAEAQLFYLREQLVRQRNLLATVARWYLAPTLPGLIVFVVGHWLDQSSRIGTISATLAALAGLTIVTLVFGVILFLNRRAARACGLEIEALDRAFANP